MSTLLLLTSALQPSAEVLPALALLGHQVKILPAEGSALLEAPEADLLLVDGRQELAHARDLCRLIRTTGTDVPGAARRHRGRARRRRPRLGHGRRRARTPAARPSSRPGSSWRSAGWPPAARPTTPSRT